MMRTAWLAGLLLASGVAANADDSTTFALVHAKLYTMTSDVPVDDATVVVRDGRIQSVGQSVAPPAGVRVIDAAGRIVTPGLMSAGTQLGLLEVASLPDTRDHALASGTLGAAFDVQYALNPNSTLLPLALADGLTRALTYPDGSAVVPFMGQAALLRLAPPEALLERAQVAMFVRAGAAAAAGAGGSRSAGWILLHNALDEARRYKPGKRASGPWEPLLSRLDTEALQPVANGLMPLSIVADRESDIRDAIRLHDDMQLPIVLHGCAEAWRVAGELASRRIPVVLDPTLNLPASFDTLGARLDNAARLAAAGVPIAFSVSAFHRTYNAGNGMRLGAGLAVANGLPWI